MGDRSWNAAVPSDGMTVDSPHGPIDTVAVERIQRYWQLHLTRADRTELTAQLTGCWVQAERVAVGLGCTRESVLARVYRANTKAKRSQPGGPQ